MAFEDTEPFPVEGAPEMFLYHVGLLTLGRQGIKEKTTFQNVKFYAL